MKELIKDSRFLKLAEITERLKGLGWQLMFSVISFFMARTSLFAGMSPLGAAITAGVPMRYILFAGAGSLLGYIMPSSDLAAFRYTAAILAITVIRFIISGIKGPALNSIWSAVTALAVVSAIGLATASIDSSYSVIIAICEGLLAGGCAYFIRRAFDAVKHYSQGLSTEQTASLLIAVNLALTALYPVSLDGVSLGRIAAYLLVLLSARYGRIGVSAVCGISSAAAFIIFGSEPSICIVICFSALFTGIFASFGKIITALSPLTICAIWTLLSNASVQSVASVAETAAAGVIFLIIPKTACAKFSLTLAPPVSTPDTKGLRRTLTMRLGFASAALKGVSETVEDVSRCLAIGKKPSFINVLHEVENDACKGCSFMLYCWEKNRKTTVDAALAMSDALRKCQPLGLAAVPDGFTEKCLRLERFEDSLSRHYSDFLSNVSAEKRVCEMRGVVSEQMNGVADMLSELSEEFRTAQNYDVAMAGRISAALKDLDLNSAECSCVIDKFGRMTVEIKLSSIPEVPINRAKILSKLEQICEREFEPPEVNRINRGCYITATEKAVFSVDCGYTQFNQGKNRLCGDTCRHFHDGRGRLIAIVSDGMGSGGRAAVDSAMTAGLAERLIKAGFGFDCTLKLVNSAMLFKSADESLATLDISCIDLFNGKTELYKAGAAPTLVRRNGRTGKAECKSLPAGILNEVGFDKAVISLKDNDIIIMMSDGVCTDGTDWICAEIESFKDGSAKQLSERLATSARRRRHDGHDDDITVFAAIIEKAI